MLDLGAAMDTWESVLVHFIYFGFALRFKSANCMKLSWSHGIKAWHESIFYSQKLYSIRTSHPSVNSDIIMPKKCKTHHQWAVERTPQLFFIGTNCGSAWENYRQKQMPPTASPTVELPITIIHPVGPDQLNSHHLLYIPSGPRD